MRSFSARLLDCPFNLTSHNTQNDLLKIAAKTVKNNIIRSVEENRFYTVVVDEACSFKQEQMTACVRYAEGLEIKQRFLRFVDCCEGARRGALWSY